MSDAKGREEPKPVAVAAAATAGAGASPAAAADTIDRYAKAQKEALAATLRPSSDHNMCHIEEMARSVRWSVLSKNTSFEDAFELLMQMYESALVSGEERSMVEFLAAENKELRAKVATLEDAKGVTGMHEEKSRLEQRVEELAACLNWDAIERVSQTRGRSSIRGGRLARGRRGCAD